MRGAILETVHGSHLYGLATATSDLDWYTVIDGNQKPAQTIRDGMDATVIGLGPFLEQVYRGVPQACEALFSRKAAVRPDFAPMLANIHVMGGDAYDRYERTIYAFSKGTLKQRRHAHRLTLNLASLRKHGQFNPELTALQIVNVNQAAGSRDD